MGFLLAGLTLVLLQLATALPRNLRACPLLGQQFPPPVQLLANPQFQALKHSFDSTLNASLKKDLFDQTSFSIGAFNLNDDGLVYQYNHAGGLLSNSTRVDADSVYRIESITKLLIVYLWLMNHGDRRFNDPITDYVPELLANRDSWNSLTVDWEEITIGDLAGQMGGLFGNFGLEDVANPSEFAPISKAADRSLPRLPPEQLPTCGYVAENGTLILCSEEEYFNGVTTMSPIFPTAYTPAYSNIGFDLLGLALARIANSPLEKIFDDSLVKPLALTSTYYSTPANSSKHDVIPGSPTTSAWNLDYGIFSPAGSAYSTTNDMAAIGKAILNSTLLPKSQTRRWLKPTSFLESFEQAVGRPWEIFRIKVSGQTVDLYTKAGQWGSYYSILALIPTYDLGYSILTAENPNSPADGALLDLLTNTVTNAFVPVLNNIAQEQAGVNFAGHYVSNSTNSSLTIQATTKGLEVTQFVNNGVDFLSAVFSGGESNLVYRIVPNQLYSGAKVGFTSFYENATPAPPNGTFYGTCGGWFGVDGETYGNILLGQMVFETDNSGRAISADLRGLRQTLRRINA